MTLESTVFRVKLDRGRRAAIGAAFGAAAGVILGLPVAEWVSQVLGLACAVGGALIGAATAPWGCIRCAVRLTPALKTCPGCHGHIVDLPESRTGHLQFGAGGTGGDGDTSERDADRHSPGDGHGHP